MKLHITPQVYFVKSGKALVETLFQPTGTASGIFKIRKDGILFMRPNGDPFAFLVANRHGERFFVTCYRFEGDGKMRYMHALTEEGERLLGLFEMSFKESHETASRVWKEANHPNNPAFGAFRITHIQGEIRATLPRGDELAEHAASAYGFVLNCPEHRNRTHTAGEFAAAIANCFDQTEPHTAAIINHLKTL
jgi:hypothetical protein